MKGCWYRRTELPAEAAEFVLKAIEITAVEFGSQIEAAGSVKQFASDEFNRLALQAMTEKNFSARQAAGLLGITTKAARKLSNEKGEAEQ